MVSVWFLMVSAVYRDRNNGSSPVICHIGFERRFSIFMGEFLSVGKKSAKETKGNKDSCGVEYGHTHYILTRLCNITIDFSCANNI